MIKRAFLSMIAVLILLLLVAGVFTLISRNRQKAQFDIAAEQGTQPRIP